MKSELKVEQDKKNHKNNTQVFLLVKVDLSMMNQKFS